MPHYLSGLVHTFQTARRRAEIAEGQLLVTEELLAQWFLDSDMGARELLIVIARHRRERQLVSVAAEETTASPVSNTQADSHGAGAV